MPEQGLGLTVLVNGDSSILDWVNEEVTKRLIPAAERIAEESTQRTHAGYFVSMNKHLDSSITLEVVPDQGLVITNWVSNGTDFLYEYSLLNGAESAFWYRTCTGVPDC